MKVALLTTRVTKDSQRTQGKFFTAPSYIYNYNEVEQVLWTSENENQSIIFNPEYQRHIFELISGMKFRLASQFYLDPYLGFRYTHYRLFGSVEGISNTNEIDEKADFWDPVIGFKAHYFPYPRVPIELKADIGGFGAGSELIWSAWINSGYTVSPTVDIIGGFGSFYNRYELENSSGSQWGLESLTYGITMGARIYLPKRAQDPGTFNKFKD